jgi:phosphohistidine phosphatase
MEQARLVIARHAEAAYTSAGDRERPLTPFGRQQAARLGHALAAAGLQPDVVVHSQARRTVETWEHMARPLGGEPRVFGEPDMYYEGPSAYLEAAARHGGDAATLLLVGHLPSVAELVELLAAERVRFGTAQAALLEPRLEGPFQGWELTLAVPLRFGLARGFSG